MFITLNKSFLERKLDWKLQFISTSEEPRRSEGGNSCCFKAKQWNHEIFFASLFSSMNPHFSQTIVINQMSVRCSPILLPMFTIIYSADFLILCMMFLLISQRSRFAHAPSAMIDWMNFVLAGDEKGKTRDQPRWNWLFRSMKKAPFAAEFFYWNFPQFFTRKVSFFRLFCNFLILLSIYSGAWLVAWVVAGAKASGKSCQKFAVQFTKYSCSKHTFQFMNYSEAKGWKKFASSR